MAAAIKIGTIFAGGTGTGLVKPTRLRTWVRVDLSLRWQAASENRSTDGMTAPRTRRDLDLVQLRRARLDLELGQARRLACRRLGIHRLELAEELVAWRLLPRNSLGARSRRRWCAGPTFCESPPGSTPECRAPPAARTRSPSPRRARPHRGPGGLASRRQVAGDEGVDVAAQDDEVLDARRMEGAEDLLALGGVAVPLVLVGVLAGGGVEGHHHRLAREQLPASVATSASIPSARPSDFRPGRCGRAACRRGRTGAARRYTAVGRGTGAHRSGRARPSSRGGMTRRGGLGSRGAGSAASPRRRPCSRSFAAGRTGPAAA